MQEHLNDSICETCIAKVYESSGDLVLACYRESEGIFFRILTWTEV